MMDFTGKRRYVEWGAFVPVKAISSTADWFIGSRII